MLFTKGLKEGPPAALRGYALKVLMSWIRFITTYDAVVKL